MYLDIRLVCGCIARLYGADTRRSKGTLPDFFFHFNTDTLEISPQSLLEGQCLQHFPALHKPEKPNE